jgi:EAL domain-containing protein (putative c-di-GMP-specific phosphodiesterase class I)
MFRPVLQRVGVHADTFGREIDATVVAEGIETREELETLRGLELSYGQGSYLASPDRLPILPCLNPGRVLEMHRTTAG